MADIKLVNINKIYPNKVQAVFDFNLEIKDKEFIVFVGPSGCGKSTTLRMIAGLEDITTGQLYIDGRYMNTVPPKDRDIAMVFQSYALYPYMTVYKNIAFALKLRKMEKPIVERSAEADGLRKVNHALRRQAKSLDRQYQRKQNREDLLEKREALYDQIFDNEAKIASLEVPIVGKDEKRIAKDQAEIARIEKEIAHYQALLDGKCEEDKKVKEAFEAELAEKQQALQGADEASSKELLKSIEKLKKALASPKYAENPLTMKTVAESISEKKGQIERFQAEIEYLENHEVPLMETRYLTSDEIDSEVNKAARSLDLVKYLYRKPAALSGGQRQRVALGRAIVRKPKVFLMDEPLSNLDAKLRVQTRSEISRITKEVGATTIYVTHDQTEAMTMADRIVIMKGGYIQQIGTPEEVYYDPANLFVAGFIGSPSMNFLPAEVKDGFLLLKDGEKEISLPLGEPQATALKSYRGRSITLGIRPEAIHFEGDQNNAHPSPILSSKLDFEELLGYERLLYVTLCGKKTLLKIDSKIRVEAGQEIRYAFDSDALYFFDSETQARIK